MSDVEMTCDPGQLWGVWAIEPSAHQQLYEVCVGIPLPEVMAMGKTVAKKELPPMPYEINGRTAVVSMSGPLTKKPTSFGPLVGGGSTIKARDALRQAEADGRVDRILLSIDSPGGTAAGTKDLHDAVKKIDSRKPVYTHFNDLGASAALWIGLGGREVSANANAQLGSIGAYTVLRNTSERLQKEGIKLHVVASGKFKGTGEGDITPEQLGELQNRIDALADLFVQDVATDRKLPVEKVKEIADGRVFIASKAKELGLIDHVCSQDDLLERLNSKSIDSLPQTGQSPRSKVMPYNAEQLAKARSLPSLAAITEEGADVAVLNAAVSLQGRVTELSSTVQAKDTEITQLRGQLPPQMNAEVLQGYCEVAEGQIDLLAAKGKLVPGQVTQLKAMIKSGDKPNPKMLIGANGQEAPYKAVLKAFDENKPLGLVTEQTQGQPAPRTEPGSAAAAGGVEQFPTFERWNEIRTQAKLSMGTKEMYEKAKIGIAV